MLTLALALTACGAAAHLSAPGPPVPSLDGYRIVYRVTTPADSATTSRRVVLVLRPFASRDETFGGEDTTPTSVSITTLDRVTSVQGGQSIDLGGRAPEPPAVDYRFSAEMGDLLGAGMAVARGTGAYAGRACRVYRFGSPLGDRLAPIGSKEHADLCIDGDGLVLGEDWMIGTRTVRRTEAIEVDATPPAMSEFAPATPAEPNGVPLSQLAEPLPLGAPPSIGAHYWVAVAPPWGFHLTHRSRVLSMSQATGVPQVDAVAYVDTYERGPDVVTVEHRQQRGATAQQDSAPARSVRVPRLGTLDVGLTAQGPQLVSQRRGWQVTIAGTLDVRRLEWFTRSLT